MSRPASGEKRSPSSARPDPKLIAGRYAAARPLQFEASEGKLNHHVFRFPAKFHPPVARKLVELFSKEGETVLDPFCGSGTLLVEAAVLGRHSIGTDVDPLAVFVARAKTAISDVAAITAAANRLDDWLEARRAEDDAQWGSFEEDIDDAEFALAKPQLSDWIPLLPRIDHWFRKRVILQLAAIRQHVAEAESADARLFLTLCFASIIRNSSNADPVPISGLEVTSHMLAKEKQGRIVDPWRLMKRAITKSLAATEAFVRARSLSARCSVAEADARLLNVATLGKVDAVVTSPPYLTAVDYYRRHTLEMYWLGLTARRENRLELMSRYIGRDRVGSNHLPTTGAAAAAVADRWLVRFPEISSDRGRAFRHYCDGMARALSRMAAVVKSGGAIVVVAGDVRFCGIPVSMLELMKDLAGGRMTITDHLWYPINNRYMSYTRHNDASIAADHVIVFGAKSEAK